MKLIRCHLRGLPWEVTQDRLNEWLQQDESFFGVTQKITRKGQFDQYSNNKASAFIFCREDDVRDHVVTKGSMPLLLDSGKLRCVLSIAVGLGTSSGLYDHAQPDEAQPCHYEALENWLQKTGQQPAAASAPSLLLLVLLLLNYLKKQTKLQKKNKKLKKLNHQSFLQVPQVFWYLEVLWQECTRGKEPLPHLG